MSVELTKRSRRVSRACVLVIGAVAAGAFGMGRGTEAMAQTPPSAGDRASFSVLHHAAEKGDLAGIADLLAKGTAVNARDRHGRTPLHAAAFARQYDAVSTLAKAGADLEALENDRYDIITIAAVADDEGMVRLAISLGANPRAITSRYDGTALIAAAHLGHDGVVRALIEAGAPLDHVNNLGWTALIEAVVLGDGGSRHVACAENLVAAGARLDIADRGGTTPRAHAVARGYEAMVVAIDRAAAGRKAPQPRP